MAVRQDLQRLPAAGAAAAGVLTAAGRRGAENRDDVSRTLAARLSVAPTAWRQPSPRFAERLLALAGGAAGTESLWSEAVDSVRADDGARPPVRLMVRGRRRGASAAVDLLLRQAEGVAAVSVEDADLPLARAWGSPLVVGFLPTAGSRELRAQIEGRQGSAQGASTRHVTLGEDAATCSVALLSSREELELLTGGRLIRCTLVLALTAAVREQDVRRAALATGASAWAVAACHDQAARVRWWQGFRRRLLRERSLDVALTAASTDPSSARVVVHLACRPEVLDVARPSTRRAGATEPAGADDAEIGAEFPESAPLLPPGKPASSERSTLQVRVTADDVPRTRTFKARAVNTMWVRIGPGEAGWWRSSDRPFPIKGLTVDATVGRAMVTVVVVQAGKDPQQANLWLEPSGRPSEPKAFDVLVGDQGSDVVVDIYAYHQTRLLQQCRVKGRASTEDDGTPGAASSSSLRPRTVLVARTALDDLGDRAAFDAAFSVDAGGRVVVHSGDSATTVLEPEGLRPLAQDVAVLFSEESRAAGPRTAKDRATFWRTLADHGRQLRQELHRASLANLDDARRVQVAGRDAVDVLPLEVVYVGGQPTEHAKPCDGWSKALSSGTCPTCPKAPRALDEATDTICPLHFWGLSRVVERCVAGQGEELGAILLSEPVRAARRLRSFDKVLVGVTDAVRDDATAGPLLRTSLDALRPLGLDVLQTRTWRTWRRRVQDHEPGLMVAIAHNALDDTPRADRPAGNRLEIGAHDGLSYARVSRAYVGDGAGGQAGPVVVLLGCNTIDAVAPYQGFTREFQENGAAVVIGALGEIWVGDAPVALASFARHLVAADWPNDSTLGDVMLGVRRQLVADDHPIAMAFAAYGDADWLLPAKGA